MVMPIVRFSEQQRQVFKILESDVGLESALSDSHQAVNVLQDLEGFLPQTKFNCDFKLVQSNLDVSVVDVSFFNVDVNGSLVVISFPLVQNSSQTFF